MPDETQTTNMAERVLGAIQERGVKPKPVWHFLLREWVVWAVALVALALGSVATALTLYIANASFFMERSIALSDIGTLFAMIPFVWLALVAVGVFYTIHAVHTTRHGYRWHTSWLVGIAIGLSLGVGWTIHALGVSEALDRYLLAEMPMYHPLSGFQPAFFSDKSQGVVAGIVTKVAVDSFTMQALDGEELDVRITHATHMPPMFEIKEGVPIRVTGTTTSVFDVEIFEAREVRPFHGRRGAMHRPGEGRGRASDGMPGGSGSYEVAPEVKER